MRGFLNLAVLIVFGVMLAGMIMPKNVPGTTALFNGMGNLWKMSINGLLGQTS